MSQRLFADSLPVLLYSTSCPNTWSFCTASCSINQPTSSATSANKDNPETPSQTHPQTHPQDHTQDHTQTPSWYHHHRAQCHCKHCRQASTTHHQASGQDHHSSNEDHLSEVQNFPDHHRDSSHLHRQVPAWCFLLYFRWLQSNSIDMSVTIIWRTWRQTQLYLYDWVVIDSCCCKLIFTLYWPDLYCLC